MTTHVASFTEYALLNRWTLDLLSPADFQKKKIATVGSSLLETLSKSKENPYSNSENSSYLYHASKYFILVPFKTAYIALVTLTLSRVGVVVNAAFTALSYLRFQHNPTDENWEKTKDFAYAFFADLTCAAVGAFLTKAVVESTFYTLHFARIGAWMGTCKLPLSTSVFQGALTLAVALLGTACLSSMQNPYIAPQFFARPQDRVGMYLSLILRQKLGLMDQNGALLPFSKDDQIKYDVTSDSKGTRTFTLYGTSSKLLDGFIWDAEWELLDKIKEYNQIAHKERKISFQYPFDGETIARSLETARSASSTVGLATREDTIINDIRNLGRKIELLREINIQAKKLTLETSIPVAFIKGLLGDRSGSSIKVTLPTCFISEKAYREYFNATAQPGSQESHRFNDVPTTGETPLQKSLRLEREFNWDSYQSLGPIDPSSVARPDSPLPEQISYDIRANIWKYRNRKAVTSFKDLFTLTSDSSYTEYKAVKRKYWTAAHPDKSQVPNANELFSCVSEIFNILDLRYK